jgi:hypothetical protein
LWAYGIGFAAMIPFFSTEHFKGPVAKALGGADIAMLVACPYRRWCISPPAARSM